MVSPEASQMPKNLLEVSTMLLQVLAKNDHIIKVGTGELLAVLEEGHG